MRFRRLIFIVSGVLALAGCRDPEVRAYRVPKEALPEPPAMAASGQTGNPHANPHAGPHGAPAAGASLAWQAPAHWEEKPAGGFRRGSYRVPGEGAPDADFSIIPFPGAAGGMVDNFNRWRAQLGLGAASASDLSATIAHVDGRNGLHFDVIELVGTVEGAPTRITGAVAEFGGQSWFFKLMGPDPVVARERQAFLDFLQTVTPAESAP